MNSGLSKMTTALDNTQNAMNCMGHKGMMSGGM